MSDFCRVLDTDIEAEYFVDGILCIKGMCCKREAINRITAAERNIKDYSHFSTLTHRDNRDFEYREESKRKDLQERIVNELFTLPRLSDDERLALGCGGAKPCANVKLEAKAFFIIGLPASGKSGIASKIADLYGSYILDADFAKRKLPEYRNQIGAATLIHEESDYIVFNAEAGLLHSCIMQKANMVIPKIGHNMKSIMDFATALRGIGYSVYLISVDLCRQKATQRAYNRYITTQRYVPLSLVFDGYSDQPTLNYFKIKQASHNLFSGYAQISTDVPQNHAPNIIEVECMDELCDIPWEG